jgi:hypothetical protein
LVVSTVGAALVVIVLSYWWDVPEEPARTSRGAGVAQLQPTKTPHPTDLDEVGDRRGEASLFLANEPELRASSEVVPAVTGFLADPDPQVRTAAAAALQRIGWSEEALASGLRDSVRENSQLSAALYDTIAYVHPVGYDDKEMRAEAVRALGVLWLDSPSATVEKVLVDQYWSELVPEVRAELVGALCQHHYTSAATEAVVVDAIADFDAAMSFSADDCLEELYAGQGP